MLEKMMLEFLEASGLVSHEKMEETRKLALQYVDDEEQTPNAVEQTDADGTSVGDTLPINEQGHEETGGTWQCKHCRNYNWSISTKCAYCKKFRPISPDKLENRNPVPNSDVR